MRYLMFVNKKISKIIILVLVMLLSSSCTNKHIDTIDDNYRVFYQIFVGSFSDSNNDGIGDLRGIINRFDYLNDGNSESKTSLGIQGIWLSPIFESPSYHKYDVTNYYKIDEDFGTMDDLKELIELAHSRNVKVILDLAINHTSTDNEWFKQFKNAHINGETNNHYYDYYVYKNADEVIPGKTWNYLGKTENYECNFSTSMPELNFDNPVVRQEVYEVAKYYLDLGVDGFRFDAAKYIYLGDDKQSTDFWAEFINKLQKIKEDVYVVGEVWSSDNETYTYISALNCFNFTLANAEGKIAETAKNGDVNLYTKYIVNYQNKIKSLNEDAMLMPFISNHDMDRSAGFLMMANKFPYVAANLLLLGPGSPFIYYGEEIGMKGSRGGSNTDANRRLAMRWGDDDTVNNPEGSTFEEKKQTNGTVKEQLENEDSLLNYYRKLIDLRNKYPEIARGDYDYYKDSTNDMGGFIVTYNDDVTGIFHNCSLTNEQSVNLSNYDFEQIADYIGCSDIAKLENNILTLGPQTSAILK